MRYFFLPTWEHQSGLLGVRVVTFLYCSKAEIEIEFWQLVRGSSPAAIREIYCIHLSLDLRDFWGSGHRGFPEIKTACFRHSTALGTDLASTAK